MVCVGTHFLHQDELYAKRFPSAIENRNMFPVNMLPFLANFQVITYMAVWVGGLEAWEIRVMCKIDFKNVFFFVCFEFVLFFVASFS